MLKTGNIEKRIESIKKSSVQKPHQTRFSSTITNNLTHPIAHQNNSKKKSY